jgi:septum formation protein
LISLPEGRRVVLASSSPRRRELLASVGLAAEIRPADIDESPHQGEHPVDYVRRLAAVKAAAVERRDGEIVLAADTTVEIDGTILGKPLDDADAARMLRLLSGRTHLVHSGVSVVSACGATTIDVSTSVTFVELDDAVIAWYVGTGEPRDKAGAYAIQGAGAAVVERVDGSVTNVIGLPLAQTLTLLSANS